MRRRHVGVDQHGAAYWLGAHPRKELLDQLGRSRAQIMYRDDSSSLGYHRVGYVIAGLWIEVFALTPFGSAGKEADA